MELKVEMIGREVIKPASPTPHDRLQLSLMDFNIPSVYISIIFFYNLADQAEKSMDVISRKLKSSLSQTLSRYYPLAGRKEGVSIICNDEGAVFTEASTDVNLSDFLGNLDINSLKVFLPTLAQGESSDSWPLLNVQITFFGSESGFAIGVAVSHNICDAASVSRFVRDWAASAKGDSSDVLSTPKFAETTIYPPPDISVPNTSLVAPFEGRRKCVMNRFVFESDKIKELKIVASSEIVPAPTRVEAITTLIWKCARDASQANLDVPRPSTMSHALDLRPRIPTLLSPDTIGNLQTAFFIRRGPGSKIEISETVAEFRKEKEKLIEMIQQNLDDSLGLKIMSEVVNYMSERKPLDEDEYGISSWCRRGFYDVDFGWGSPAWLGPYLDATQSDMMFVVLMDAKDGEGVEAWVALLEPDMTAFVCDQDLLTYASVNPPVLL